MSRAVRLLKMLICLALICACVIGACAVSFAASSTGVTKEIVNLRDAPNSASNPSKVIATVPKNKKVTIIEKTASWYYIDFSGTKGYIFKDFIDEVPSGPVAVGSFGTTTSSLTVRKTAAKSGKKLGTIGANAVIEVLENSGEYSKVRSTSGKVGYVLSDKLQSGRSGVISADSATVYKAAKEKSAIVATLSKNAQVTVLRTTSAWYLVQSGAVVGYVKAETVTMK